MELKRINETFAMVRAEQQLEKLKTQEKIKTLKEKYTSAQLAYQQAEKIYNNKFGCHTTKEIMAMDYKVLKQGLNSSEYKILQELGCMKNTLSLSIKWHESRL